MTQIAPRFWQVPASNQFQFPEVSDTDLIYDPIISRPNCGIAFSGGGTVSAALAPGFLKALEDLDLMKNVRYISGVSGGTWGTAAYCYAIDQAHRENYFGKKITTELKSQTLADWQTADIVGSMTQACTNALLGRLTFERVAYTHEAYTRAVGHIFLKPFDIDGTNSYFSSDQKAVNNITLRNQSLKTEDFITLYSHEDQSQSSPYYIMNGSLLSPPTKDANLAYEAFPFEFTPLYSGLKGNSGPDSTGETIGGYYVESYGFNTTNPTVNTEQGWVDVAEASNKFILSSPVGTSGSALEKLLAQIEFADELTLFLPQFNYWNPADLNEKQPTDALMTQPYLFGDGGISENTGISALLARKVENVVLFITEPYDITPVSTKSCEQGQRYFGYNQMAHLFGAPYYKKNGSGEHVLVDAYQPFQKFFKFEDYADVQTQLINAKKNNGPVIITKTLEVQQNLRFGIEGGWNVNVTFVVVDTCDGFNHSLDSSVYSNGKFVPEELENFPAVCTFGQNMKGDIPTKSDPLIQLTPAQANLLANQAYWMIATSDIGRSQVSKTLG